MSPLRILILEDQILDAELALASIRQAGYSPDSKVISTKKEFLENLDFPEIILSDYSLPGFNGFAALEILKEKKLDIPFIMLTGTLGEENVVEAMRRGATDYLVKTRLSALGVAVTRALKEKKIRAEAREALSQSEERFRLLVDNVKDYAVFMLDHTGHIATWNVGAERIYGYKAEEMVGQPVSVLYETDKIGNLTLAQWLEKIEKEGRLEEEAERFRKDGNRFWAHCVTTAVRDDKGRLQGFSRVSRDITERKQSRLELTAAEAKFRGLVERSLVGIYIIQDDRFVYVNPKMAEILGFSQGEMTSSTLLDFIAEEDREKVKRNVERRLKGEVETIHYELRMLSKSGKIIIAEAQGSRSEYEGRPAIIGTLLDVTERKKSETIATTLSVLTEKLSLAEMPEDAARIINEATNTLVSTDAFLIRLYAEETDTIRSILEVDQFEGPQETEMRDPHKPTELQRQILSSGPHLILREESNSFLMGAAPFGNKSRPSASLMFVPIRSKTKTIGIMSAQSYRRNAYDQDDLRTLQMLADQCGGALERIAANAALRESESQFRLLWDTSNEGLLLTNRDGIVLKVNDAYCRMVEKSKAEMEGRSLAVALEEKEGVRTINLLRERMDSNTVPFQTEKEVTLWSERKVWFGVSYSVFQSPGQAPLLLTSFRDITKRKRAEKALQRTEELYRRAIAGADMVPYAYDYKTRSYLFMGEGIEHLTGYRPEEVSGDLWKQIIQESVMLGEAKGLGKPEATQRVIEGQLRHWRSDMRILTRDGKTRWISDISVQNLDENGLPIGSMGILEDITARKEAEEELRERERQLLLAQRQAKLGSWEWDMSTNSVIWSDELYRIFGLELKDTPPTYETFLKIVHPEDRVLVRQKTEQSLRDHQSFDYEFRIIRPDGIQRVIHGQGGVQVDPVSGAVRMTGTDQDVTERKLSEKRVREQAQLLDKAQDAIYVRDLEQRITYWNKAAEHIYGWTAEEVIGERADKFIYKNITKEFVESQKSVFEKGELTAELKQLTKGGREIVVAERCTLLRDENGRPTSILNINSDITEKKKLETQFLRAQRMESIGTLAGGIAHDLNNILAPILMAVQLLKMKDGQSAEEEKMLDAIDLAAQRGAGMVQQVLSFARGSEGARTPVPVRHLVIDQEKIIRETFPKSIRLKTHCPKDIWSVMGDATQLYQVLMNLCVNARDAMPDGGDLKILAENNVLETATAIEGNVLKSGPYVVLTVSDSGTGMPPDVKERIFDPFFTTKEPGKGTGLGLSTVLGIVKSHGGFMEVESEVGQGTRFKIYLPALVEAPAASDAKSKLAFPAGAGKMILVVDDEPSIRTMTQAVLARSGYRVITARDGTQAISLFALHKNEIELVITDMSMPFMDGQSTIRALQKMSPAVKILAVSGIPENARAARAAANDRVTFLQKPYSPHTLLELVTSLVAGPLE